MRRIVKLCLILTASAIVLLAPGFIIMNGRNRNYPSHLILLEKINARQWRVPIVEIYPIQTAFVPSTQSTLDVTDGEVDQTSSQQISDWFKRSHRYEPNESINHTSHRFYKPFLITNDQVCGTSTVDILIYIQSLPENYARRSAIRETWGGRSVFTDINLETVFIVGRSGSSNNGNEIQQFLISNENLMYRDIIQLDFVDSFKNLPIKSIGALRWIYQYCPQAKYIIKTDDDIYVNMFLVVENIISEIWQRPLTLACHFKKNGTSPIVRTPSSKWYVPNEIFKGYKYFPVGFCSGYAVLFTADLIPIMYKNSFNIPYTIVDDVYVFGVLLDGIKDVKYINYQRNFTLDQGRALKEYESKNNITHLVVSSWAKDSMQRYWYATITKLTDWAKRHSALSNSIGPGTT